MKLDDIANNPLADEILSEQAHSLFRVAREFEDALDRLQKFDAEHPRETAGRADSGTRSALVQTAARLLWYLIVQRECLGLTDHSVLYTANRIPEEVRHYSP